MLSFKMYNAMQCNETFIKSLMIIFATHDFTIKW